MLNVTIPRWAHIILMLLSAVISAVVLLAAKGQIVIEAPVLTVLGLILTVINSVDPEVAAKTLPAPTLARMADQKKLEASEVPTNPNNSAK